MPRLSRAQEAVRRRVARVAGAGLAPEPLAERLVAAVAGAIPVDGYRLFGVDPGTLLVNRVLAASANDGWARLEWLREVYLAAAPLTYLELPTLMGANLPAVAFQDRQEACWGYPPAVLATVSGRDHRRLFHELRSPVGGTLLAGFAAGGWWVAALQAYRRDPDRPFRAGEIGFVRLLAPTIGRALAASLARERATRVAGPAAPDASGILILGSRHELRFATPAGEAWRDLLADVDRSAHAPLPTAVWAAIAGLRRGGEGVAANAVVAATPVGPVRVEASPAGAEGEVAIVIAPVRPAVPPTTPDGWSLTRQERRVVDLLARGLTNREIAAALSVGEHTVEWHLGHAYEKLGVESRTRLLARFFHEVYLPAFAGEDGAMRGATDDSAIPKGSF